MAQHDARVVESTCYLGGGQRGKICASFVECRERRALSRGDDGPGGRGREFEDDLEILRARLVHVDTAELHAQVVDALLELVIRDREPTADHVRHFVLPALRAVPMRQHVEQAAAVAAQPNDDLATLAGDLVLCFVADEEAGELIAS